MNEIPRFIPNANKALETVLWLAQRKPGIDVYHLVKAVFFADKYHVTNYGRPLFGESYVAAPFGPLAQVLYNLLKHDPMEMLALENNGDIPVRIKSSDGYRIAADRAPNIRKLSESDIEALEHGVTMVENKSFDELLTETHADPAYRLAVGRFMDFRDFIPDSDALKTEKAEAIAETAEYSVF